MGLNEIKVPGLGMGGGARLVERDSWKVLSHVWAGRSVGQEQVAACASVWLKGEGILSNALPAKLQALRDLPQLPRTIFFFFTHRGAWERRVSCSPAACLDTF